MRERRQSSVFGYGHLPLLAALAAVGVGVRLAIEEALGGGEAAHAAPVLGGATGAAVLALVQWATPASLPRVAVAGRCALAAVAIAVAVTGDELSAPALTAVLAAGAGAELVLEALRGSARPGIRGRSAPRARGRSAGPSRARSAR